MLAIAALTCAIAAPVLAADVQKNGQKSEACQLRTDMRKLWEDHITWTRMWIVSFAAGAQDQEAITARLMQNQVDIGASFLSGANAQNWPLDAMKAAMKGHLDTTVQEATDRLAGKWDADIKDYDRVHEHILKLADTLTDGIGAQHAKKFSG